MVGMQIVTGIAISLALLGYVAFSKKIRPAFKLIGVVVACAMLAFVWLLIKSP